MEHTDCNLCGAGAPEHLITLKESLLGTDNFSVVRCRACGLAYTDPRPLKTGMGRYYPSDYGPYKFTRPAPILREPRGGLQRFKTALKKKLLSAHGGYFVPPENKANGWLFKFLTAPLIYHLSWIFPPWREHGRALDIGCSTGEYLYRLKELGWDAYGVELDGKAAAWAADELGLKVTQGELQEAAFPAGYFDAVTLFHSLEHVYDPLGTLKEANRILKPDGTLMIEIPILLFPEGKLFGDNWSAWEVPRHLYHFTPETVEKMLRAAGFSSVEKTHLPYLNILAASVGNAVGGALPALRSAAAFFFDTGRNRALNLVLTPLAYALALAGHTGRLLVYAKK